jgi:branched-chain amino acid transport system ATP-binding protein
MLLTIDQVHAGYGDAEALHGVSLSLAQGAALGLLGRNGMGRSTLINAIMGICPPTQGRIEFLGARIDGLPPHAIARRGIGLVPEGRRIFPNLSVRENLVVAARGAGEPPRWTLERVLDFFPRLRERLTNPGNLLSGGEQQMLAIGRALLTNPRLLILDEATEGLAPLIREEIWACLQRLKDLGHSILLIDKNLDELAHLADRSYIMEKGRVVWQGPTRELTANEQLRLTYLGV